MTRKIALITGATSGIGESCARKFAHAGYDLILMGRNTGKLENLKNELEQDVEGITVLALAFDIRNREAAKKAVDYIPETLRNIDVLINNAGLARGLEPDYEVEGDFPRYGNDDDRADEIAVWLLKTFLEKVKENHTYRNSEATTSILTITSNVVYGKATGSLPDGRKGGEPLSPGANPAYGAEKNGLLASLNSVAKLPYEYALDGISNTQTINPGALGHSEEERVNNLVTVLDGYFDKGAHHLNVNVFGVEKLKDAMEHPEKPEYANFTIRVSGYAVKFIDLTREQQLDVISRTCHDRM